MTFVDQAAALSDRQPFGLRSAGMPQRGRSSSCEDQVQRAGEDLVASMTIMIWREDCACRWQAVERNVEEASGPSFAVGVTSTLR